MDLRTFRGRTVDEARRAAVAALGEDAVVVSARRVPRLGLGGFLGGVDVELAVAPQEAAGRPDAPAADGGESTAAPTRLRDDAGDLRTEIQREIRELRGAAQNATSSTPELEVELSALRAAVERLGEPDLAPRGNAIARFVRDVGLEGKAAVAATKAIKAAPTGPLREMLRDALTELVTVAPWPLGDTGRLLITLVGPAGVGKTTTAAKLGARAILEQERSVAFVSCDGFRVGAFEQLQRFAGLLGAASYAVESPAEFRQVLDNEGASIIIVDTAGLAPGTQGSLPILAAAEPPGRRSRARTGGRSRHTLLTLPAALRATDALRFAREYRAYCPTALAITKLDETASPVGLVHGPVAIALPVSVLCGGQRVPEDVSPATRGAILDALVPRGRARDE